MIDHTGTGELGANTEIVVGDGAELRVVSIQAGDSGSIVRGPARRAGRPGRPAEPRRGHARRRASCGCPPTSGTPVRAATRTCSVCTSPSRASTTSTGCSSTTRRRTARATCIYKGALAGDDGAHGVDRRRADPGRGRGHRHVRAEPEPGADRRRPRRLGAEPGDRDRRDRGRRACVGDRPVRRRAAVLPAGPRHPRGRGAAAGGVRLLQRHHRQDRRPRGRRAAARRDRARSCARDRRAAGGKLGSRSERHLRARLRGDRHPGRGSRSRSRSAVSRSRS